MPLSPGRETRLRNPCGHWRGYRTRATRGAVKRNQSSGFPVNAWEVAYSENRNPKLRLDPQSTYRAMIQAAILSAKVNGPSQYAASCRPRHIVFARGAGPHELEDVIPRM